MRIISWTLIFASLIAIYGCGNSQHGVIVTSISGTISYNGNYGGQNETVYIRGYREDGRAVGEPDFMVSIANAGYYEMALNGYEGDLYVSAFMDIDDSGSSSGPSANDTLVDGVYSDPMGCYGDYTFESGPERIIVNGEEEGIDFELWDSGVIKANLPDTGHCTFGVIKEHTVSDEFLHHTHWHVATIEDPVLLAAPPKQGWFCKVKFDDSTPLLYPDSINVSVNSIVEIDF